MLLRQHMDQLDISKRLIFLLPQVPLQDKSQELSFNLNSL